MRFPKFKRVIQCLIVFTPMIWTYEIFFSSKNLSMSYINSTNLLKSTNRTLNASEIFNKNLWTKYLITEENFCHDRHKNLRILVYIHSAPSHFLYRALIRSTWANKRLYDKIQIAAVFIVGKSNNLEIDSNILWESNVYHDMIQGDYVDTYRNLTYKAVSALQWVSKYCRQTKYVVRVDDDVFVNIYNLNRFVDNISVEYGVHSKTLFCSVRYNDTIDRNKYSKWYVDAKVLKNQDRFPTYCLGYAIIMSTEVVHELLKAVDVAPYIWLDDVFITGLTAQIVNVTHKNIKDVYAMYSPDVFKSKFRKAIFGHVNGHNSLVRRQRFWNEAEDLEYNLTLSKNIKI